MKQLLFVSFTFLCFSLLSQTHLHLCILYHLIWRVYQMSENRGRDDSWSFLVFNEYLPMVWISLFTAERPDEKIRSGPLREGR